MKKMRFPTGKNARERVFYTVFKLPYGGMEKKMRNDRFTDKTVLFVGAGWGIGEAGAKAFAGEGARVVVAGRTASKLIRVADDIKKAGGEASTFACDVSKEDEIARMVEFTVRTYKTIDVLINNTTSNTISSLWDMPLEGWNYTLAVTLTAPFLAMKAVFPYMKARGGGAIVNTGSKSAYFVGKNFSAYNAAKAGVINLTKSAAYELAPYGIRVNCVCPGLVETPPIQALFKEVPGLREKFVAAHPVGRIGRAEDIAGMMLFLASQEASYITGQAYLVDGGASIYNVLPSRDSI